MNRVIKADLYRYGGLSNTRGLLRGLFIPGFRYTYLLRKAHKCKKYSIPWFFYVLLLRRYSFKYGFQISWSANIGEGFYIGHRGTIIIDRRATIGKNFNVAPGVTVGQASRGKYKGHATIGDNVWIGTGAVVIGKINIGSNVLIAPNSFVNRDVPSNSFVFGNPSKIISNEKATEGYISFTLEDN